MGPVYIIYDIVVWAHLYHIIYVILLGGPSIYNMRYCRVGPPYIICDIVGWAHLYHIIYAILLGRPSIYNMRYCRVGPSVTSYICNITGWAQHIPYAML